MYSKDPDCACAHAELHLMQLGRSRESCIFEDPDCACARAPASVHSSELHPFPVTFLVFFFVFVSFSRGNLVFSRIRTAAHALNYIQMFPSTCTFLVFFFVSSSLLWHIVHFLRIARMRAFRAPSISVYFLPVFFTFLKEAVSIQGSRLRARTPNYP